MMYIPYQLIQALYRTHSNGLYKEIKCLTVSLDLQTLKSLLMSDYQISCNSSKLCSETCHMLGVNKLVAHLHYIRHQDSHEVNDKLRIQGAQRCHITDEFQ
jgi:hypothetical protein